MFYLEYLYSIIRIVIQFLRENNLNESARILQSESQINLNFIDNRRDFAEKVTAGRWDEVLEEISQLTLNLNLLSEIHEQVITLKFK